MLFGKRNGQGQKKILLTSVCRPFGMRYGDAFTTSTQALRQLMWAQGPFRIEDHAYHWGLDVIAENITAPTVVLHYPSLKELRAEAKKGYDYIGISFVPPTFHKVKPMIEVIRQVAPQSKIILGGLGTSLSDEELAPYGDLICREEGITYFRRLLDEPEKPFVNPTFVAKSDLFSLPLLGKSAVIFAGVGCSHGCDFCLTSHYFKRRHHRFLHTGEEILQAMLKVKKDEPDVEAFVVYDEDFLLNQKRARGFLEAVRQTDERLALTIFGSVKALSQYEPTELAEMGISAVWIGFEAPKAGYKKMEGKPYRQLVEDLRSVGISSALSMILGYDYQTEEILQREFNELLQLRPALSQFLLYGPCRDTPLYHRLKEEGRLNEVAHHFTIMQDGFTLGFEHPHISAPRIERMLFEFYEDEYQSLGPTIFRTMHDSLTGYRNLKDATAPRLRIKAAMLYDFLRGALAAEHAGRIFSPNNLSRARNQWIIEQIKEEIGEADAFVKAQSYLVLPMVAWTNLRFRWDLFDQPKLLRRQYNI